MNRRKWSQNVRIRPAELTQYGWREHESAESRHRAIERSIRADGYATTVRRLNFLGNVANRMDNAQLRRTARADERWAQEWEDEVREGDNRSRGGQHRVDGYRKDNGEYVRPHLASNPRR